MTRHHSPFALLLVATVSVTPGCKKASQDTATPASGETAVEADTDDATSIPAKDPNKGGISIGPKIAQMCDLESTQFEFDSSALSDEAKAVLDALAACFTDGPAAGKSMRLVGHADPRGDEEYNMGLGQRRAGAVARYLQDEGLEGDRLETWSRGELDATGTDEPSWALDRKVEIFLAE